MERFIDRVEEWTFLNEEYEREGSSLVVLYGRRRVGKTALATEIMKGKNALYFLVTEESEQQNLEAFKNMVGDFCDNSLLKMAKVDQWQIPFEILLSKAEDEKLLLVLDEFQYLGKSDPAFPSVFQKIWDTMLKDKNIMVILCGSLISMMESQTLHYSSPLYGRRTGQIKLKQIPFQYYKEFFPNLDRKNQIEYYGITGGVPKYMEMFAGEIDVFMAIEKNVLSKQSFLYDEPNFLLQREVGEVGSYFSIMRAIAAGNHKLSKIASYLGLKQTNLTRYLKTLMDLDLLKREVPITEEIPEKSKRGLYKIKDNYIAFWFRFVYPNLSFLESGKRDHVMRKIRDHMSESHTSYVYEDVCIERLWQMNDQGPLEFVFDRAGRWWNNKEEIDIVAYESKGENIIFGECKYWKEKVGKNVLFNLERKAQEVEWKRGKRKEHFVLFGLNGFTEDLMKLTKEREDVLLVKEV
ncbi:ATP-binding protein [Alkalibacter rhizosphaerae]|uniref:ATP-binding protein n=1 Tax=Alkalibacter rhizosphaerae TaxID=2815577 RepID=A0A974XD55_9FIRM|nr:ATP-binding protein [Alkalibacter rhizosphaerae]QSX07652.1 ATP-binding protein [Alkalibacter rhizosphaerae]